MNRAEKYNQLVAKRKKFEFAQGLLNPSQIENGKYDTGKHIGPWSAWQGNLNAKILLIGQDWGDIDYYRNNCGCDTDNNPTNKNLIELFKTIGIDIGLPSKPNYSAPTFFTNSILGIKDGGMSAQVTSLWAKESTENFLIPLLNIIEPKIIVTLGTMAYGEVARVYKLPKQPLRKLIKTPIKLSDGKYLFAMYHCGGLGLANRSLELQKQDWAKIAEALT